MSPLCLFSATRLPQPFVAACLLILLCALPVALIADECVSSPIRTSALLNVECDESGRAELNFTLYTGQPLTTAQQQTISQALGQPLSHELMNYSDFDSEEESEETERPTELQQENADQRQGAYHLYQAHQRQKFSFNGQIVTAEVELSALLRALNRTGADELRVIVRHPNTGYARDTAAQYTMSNAGLPFVLLSYAFPVSGASAQSLHIEYGWTSAALMKSILPLLALPLLPIIITLLSCRSMLRKHQRQPGSVTITSLGFFQLLGVVFPLMWLLALHVTGMRRIYTAWLSSQSDWIAWPLGFLIEFGPTLTVVAGCVALLQGTIGRIQGIEKRFSELVQQATAQILLSLPLLLLIDAAVQAMNGGWRKGMTLSVIAILLMGRAGKTQWQAMGLQPRILDAGELRQRVSELAGRAGVKLHQIYVVADINGKTANAFAASGNNLLLTEYLLKRLSRREADSVIAHELTHLKHRHPASKALISLLAFVLPLLLMFPLIGLAQLAYVMLSLFIQAPRPFVMALFSLLPLSLLLIGGLISAWFSRHFEFTADAGAAALTGDPEATITMLARLGRLNLEPMERGRWQTLMLSHPSIHERIQSIATLWRIPQQRVDELLGASNQDDSLYAVPVTTSPQSSKDKNAEVTVGAPVPLILPPILSLLFGMIVMWLLLTPGYVPRQLLDAYQIPAWLLVIAGGLCFGWRKCVAIKAKFLKSVAQRAEFISVSLNEAAALDSVAAMDELLTYTGELETLGFVFLGDYTVDSDGEILKPETFHVRLFAHPERHCYAEITRLINRQLGPRPLVCAILSESTDGWTLTTSNREPDGADWICRLPQSLWTKHPGWRADALLAEHLCQRQQTGWRISESLSAENYCATSLRILRELRSVLERTNAVRLLIETDQAKKNLKSAWLGDQRITRKTQPAKPAMLLSETDPSAIHQLLKSEAEIGDSALTERSGQPNT
jgi:heat shock protein HtpX